MKSNITIGEKYGPAMEITDPAKAAAYFAKCVQHSMKTFGKARTEAEKQERENLAYYAGYYGAETRERVERLFKCEHPIFGSSVTPCAPVEPAPQLDLQLATSLATYKEKYGETALRDFLRGYLGCVIY